MSNTVSYRMGALFFVAVVCSPIHKISAQDTTFVRYTTPGQCAQHSVRLERQYWRDKRYDSVYSAPFGDRYQPSTVASVRKCLEHIDVNALPEQMLLMLGEAYLAAELDSSADSAFRRLNSLKSSRSIAERAWSLAQIVDIYANASPARIPKALAYMGQLDALGRSAAAERLIARQSLIAVAMVADSLLLIEANVRAAVKAGKEMVGDTRKQRAFDELGARLALAELHIRRYATDSMPTLINSALLELGPLRRSVKQYIDYVVPRYRIIGQLGASLQASRWYTKGTGQDTLYPVPGKPMLIVFASHACGSYCYQGYAVLRRLQEKHGPFGLQTVFLTKTGGYYGNRLFQPEEEMEHTRRYFHEYLGLSGTLAVWKTTFSMRDDNRRIDKLPPTFRAYSSALNIVPSGLPNVVLVDKQGKIRMSVVLNKSSEARIDNILKEMR